MKKAFNFAETEALPKETSQGKLKKPRNVLQAAVPKFPK